MPTYEVKQVSDKIRPWQSKQGSENLSYTVDLLDKGADKTLCAVEWAKKKTSRPPEVGEEVVGHIEPGPYSEKLKVDYEETRALTGGTNARDLGYKGSGGKWQPESERDPERSARILRQHSQEMALRWVALLRRDANPDPIVEVEQVFELADRFDQDVNKAGQAARGGAGNASSEPAPAPPSQPVVDLQECAEALDTAGLMSGPAQNMVAEYMALHLSPELCEKAVRQLTNAADLETQAMTLKALKANTEKHYKTPLPAHGDSPSDDDIPF